MTSSKKRRVRTVTRDALPDNVRGADYRERGLLGRSPATIKSHEARRGAPLLVPDSVKTFGMHKLSVSEVMKLRIDARYQREEVMHEVNELILVLKKGGIIPDPISVAERKYGDRERYIVDGQQRWWAHVDTETPMLAVLYHVYSYEDEVKLFHALNTQTRVSPEQRLRSLPGPAGEVVRRVNEDAGSPLYQKVGFRPGAARHGGIGAMILLRGLLSLIGNVSPVGSIDRIAPAFDRLYKMHPGTADKLINQYVWLVSQVFENSSPRSVSAVALARMVFGAHTNGQEMPTGRQLMRLKAVKWDSLSPTASFKWVPTVVAAVQDVWPVQLAQTK